jgi:hypothetical protein
VHRIEAEALRPVNGSLDPERSRLLSDQFGNPI